MTSRYHNSKISGSQQCFWTGTAICIIERWKKSMGYRFNLFPSAIMHSKVISVNFFVFFLFNHICGTTVCLDPEILLPWQRDVLTSPLY